MTTTTPQQIIAAAAAEWGGDQTITQAVCEKHNCETAEVYETGEIWISGPQTGRWLAIAELASLVDWMRSRQMIPLPLNPADQLADDHAKGQCEDMGEAAYGRDD